MPSHFVNDIFISYSHKDNSEGWVEKFQERLQHRLDQLDVVAIFWRDKKLGGADRFSDEIFDQLKQSALLVSIVSPTGMRSNWCRDERQKFEQFAQTTGGFKVGNKIRAIKVVKTPEDGDTHRALFSTLGYEFYKRDEQSGNFHEFHFSEPEYDRLVDELAQEIKKILPLLRTPQEDVSKPKVYVALATSDLDAERGKIVQQLIDWGCAVYPDVALRTDTPTVRQEINAQVDGCAFSVHLVSDRKGMTLDIPGEEEKPLAVVQYEVVDARKIDRVVWVRPGSPENAAFEAARAAGSQRGLDFLENCTIDVLKEKLVLKLKRLKEPESDSVKNGKPSLYVVCDRKDHPFVEGAEDRENALKLKAFLEGQGISVWHPPSSVTDKRELLKDHRRLLLDSRAVVFYWGAADESWIRGHRRELEAARVKRRNNPFAEAIYFSRPKRPEKAQYRQNFVEGVVIDEFEEFEPERLRPLLKQILAS